MSTPSVCKNCIYLYQAECNHSHGPLVPTEVSCGGKVAGRERAMNKLPPLPMPSTVWHKSLGFPSTYSDAQMREYGQKCRDAALDEVAAFIKNGSFLHDQSPAKLFANEVAPKILELK